MLTFDMSDVDLYDAFCHKQDRSYTITELYNFVRKAGLEIIKFSERRESMRLTLNHLDVGEDVNKLLSKFDAETQEAIAELIDGTLDNHNVFLAKRLDTEASLDDENIVPYVYGNPQGFKELLMQNETENTGLTINLRYWYSLAPYLGIFNKTLHMTQEVKEVLEHVYKNSNNTLAQIIKDVSEKSEKHFQTIKNDFKTFYEEVKQLNLILLRGRNSTQIRTNIEILSFCQEN